MVVRIARELYSLRLEELKRAISEDEEKFLILVSEIDDIRTGKWDNQLLGLPDTPLPLKETDIPSDLIQPTDDQLTTEEGVKDDNEDEIVAEEQQKVEADNFENEARNVRDRDVTPDMSGMPTMDTPPQNIPTSSTSFNEIEDEVSTEDQGTPDINIASEQQEQFYDTYNIDQHTHPLKSRIDDTDISDLPPLKRQKTEDITSTIYEGNT